MVKFAADLYNPKGSLIGSIYHYFPNVSENCQKFGFGLGSEFLSPKMLSNGSAVIIDGDNGAMVQIRSVPGTNEIRIEMQSLTNLNGNWKGKKISPRKYYPGSHHVNAPLITRVSIIKKKKKEIFTSKKIS